MRSVRTYILESGHLLINGCIVFLVRLVGNDGIRGFLVQARMPGNTPGSGVDPMLLGSFQDGNGQQTLDCDFMAGAANEVMLRVLFD